MHLIHDSVAIEIPTSHRNFIEEMPDIGIDAVRLMRDDLVASAVEAGAGAERNVNVCGQGLRFARATAGGRSLCILVNRDAIGKLLRGRVGRVSRSFAVIATPTVGIE